MCTGFRTELYSITFSSSLELMSSSVPLLTHESSSWAARRSKPDPRSWTSLMISSRSICGARSYIWPHIYIYTHSIVLLAHVLDKKACFQSIDLLSRLVKRIKQSHMGGHNGTTRFWIMPQLSPSRSWRHQRSVLMESMGPLLWECVTPSCFVGKFEVMMYACALCYILSHSFIQSKHIRGDQ